MNVLVIAAHPDDEVLGAGATMHRLAGDGHGVFSCIVSNSSVVREATIGEKAIESNRVLGSEVVSIGRFETMKVKDADHHAIVRFIESALRRVRPDIVVIHNPSDIHVDHQVVAECSLEAVRLPQRQIEESHPIRRVLMMEVPSSTEWGAGATAPAFSPNAYVEVSDSDVRAKLAAVSLYDSLIRPEPHPRSVAAVEALATVRGAAFGVRRAEAFQMVFGEAI